MAWQTRLAKLIGIIDEGLLLIFWLVLVLGLFYPWENFVNPTGNAIGQSHTQVQGFGTTHAVDIVSYVCILLLSLIRWKGVFRTLWLAWPVLILCAWIFISVCWLPDPAKSGAGRFLIIVVFSAYVASRYGTLQFVGFLTR